VNVKAVKGSRIFAGDGLTVTTTGMSKRSAAVAPLTVTEPEYVPASRREGSIVTSTLAGSFARTGEGTNARSQPEPVSVFAVTCATAEPLPALRTVICRSTAGVPAVVDTVRFFASTASFGPEPA
jgi:hypothetical protein